MLHQHTRRQLESVKISVHRTLLVVAGLAAAAASPMSAAAALDSTATLPMAPRDSLQPVAFVEVNSEEETYLRYLQLAGAVPLYPWSLRGFSPAETRRLAARSGGHPWTLAPMFAAGGHAVRLLPLAAELRHNFGFPYGSNDGPVWAGRGLTGTASGGITGRLGPVSLVLAPIAFITQNTSFTLMPNGETGARRFGDGQHVQYVDRPQRFGDGAYGRIDPGNSTVRLDAGPIAAGLSTANVAWGPFERYPFILGSNAPGFLHGFLGTSRPANIWIGSVHARALWGRLEQSEYSPVEGGPAYVSVSEPGTRRFASGLVLIFEPRGVRGLELGLSRFFHSPWPADGLSGDDFKKPFESILKRGVDGAPEFSDPGATADNQLISGFVRWAFPTAGFEMYAEYGREDHSWDRRDFLQEPDHSRSYGLGLRKVLRLRPARMDGLTVELINFQFPHLARTGRGGGGGTYIHSVLRQGHTHRGQLLGADVGVDAAAGSTIRWDGYSPAGRASVALHRVVRQQRGTFHLTGVSDPDASDVQYALEGERLRRFRGIELTARIALIHEFNRDFGADATSASLGLGARIPLSR
jgi:hypothetical protein